MLFDSWASGAVVETDKDGEFAAPTVTGSRRTRVTWTHYRRGTLRCCPTVMEGDPVKFVLKLISYCNHGTHGGRPFWHLTILYYTLLQIHSIQVKLGYHAFVTWNRAYSLIQRLSGRSIRSGRHLVTD